MKSYSQSKEDIVILDYFKLYNGTLLDIGANDGITFSNSRLLIENGWKASVVEPGYYTCKDLLALYVLDDNVKVWDYGIGDKNEWVYFWESENHVPNGNDKGLVSTSDFEETKRWTGVKFVKKKVMMQTFDKHCANAKESHFDFISIDTEGNDWIILQQIDLEKVGCKCLCIEWNSSEKLFKLFSDYCKKYSMFCFHQNAENLIFCR